MTFRIMFGCDITSGMHSVATNRPSWSEPESLASPTLWRSDRRNRHSNVHQSALQASTQSTSKMSKDARMSHMKDIERPTFPTFTVKVAKPCKTSRSRQRLNLSTRHIWTLKQNIDIDELCPQNNRSKLELILLDSRRFHHIFFLGRKVATSQPMPLPGAGTEAVTVPWTVPFPKSLCLSQLSQGHWEAS